MTDVEFKLLNQFAKTNKVDTGFTLIELLVVIIIIGILSAIALPSFLNQANKARQTEAQTYVGTINRGQQAYFLENNEFAGGLDNLELGISDSDNYTYFTGLEMPDAGDSVTTIANPNGILKGYAGRVFVGQGDDGTATTLAVLCEGEPGDVPNVAGVDTQGDCP